MEPRRKPGAGAGGAAPRWLARLGALLVGLAASGAWADPEQAQPEPEPQEPVLSGVRALSPEEVRAAAGTPPATADARALARWAKGAVELIVRTYHERGYVYARAWSQIGKDGTLRIHVDEGRVRVAFKGAGSVRAFFYRVDLNLPHRAFHRPTLDRAMQELERKYGLLNVYYRVKEPGELEITPFGEAVPVRVLQIYVVRREHVGWGFNVSLSATWGVVPGVTYEKHGLLWSDDELRTEVELAFPYRRYLFDEDPKFGWVHGGIQLDYQLPRMAGDRLAPGLESDVYVSRFGRSDLGTESYYTVSSANLAQLAIYLGQLKIEQGLGAHLTFIFEVTPLESTTTVEVVPESGTFVPRFLSRSRVSLITSAEALRRDQRDIVTLDFDLLSAEMVKWTGKLELEVQQYFRVGRHAFPLRARGLDVEGDVRFWDEVQLAGSYQRVFFGNRYWVRRALQLETAYRVQLWWDWFELGAFHDVSLFGDRTGAEPEVAVANAFGPSVHFLLFDIFAVSIYSGFGFSPRGFDHTFSFNMQTVF